MFLEVKNISKKFGNLQVLDKTSFGINKGEVVAILGQSGVGKTTLLRCLNFLEKPDEGIIEIDGKEIYDARKDINLSEKEIRDKRLHFGLVFQAFNLFPQYTVKENITLACKLRSDDASVYNIKADELLKSVGLSNKSDYYPYQLSGGQQQRVAIARALILEPDVLCFDEPTSALDPALVGEVVKVMKELKAQGRAIMVVTHDMNFASKAADRIIFMDGGKIVEEGSPEQIFGSPKNDKTKEFIKSYVE